MFVLILTVPNLAYSDDAPYIWKSYLDSGGVIFSKNRSDSEASKLANQYCSNRQAGNASVTSPSEDDGFVYKFSCKNNSYSAIPDKPNEEVEASKKYYEYQDINKKEFANRKEVVTPYDYRGNGGFVPEKSSSSVIASVPDPLQLAKQHCAELGFKPKTEKFGSCVLELRKRTQATPSDPVHTQQNLVQAPPIVKPKGDGSDDDVTCQRYGFTPQTDNYGQCRMQIDNARREMQVQQARYSEQQKQYDTEVERQRALKQQEFWLRFGNGEKASEAYINTWGNGVKKPSPPPTTQIITMPNGRSLSCTRTGDITSCL